MFSTINHKCRRLIQSQLSNVKKLSSIPPKGNISDKGSKLQLSNARKFNLTASNVGLEQNEFQVRRYALAEKLAKHIPILGLPEHSGAVLLKTCPVKKKYICGSEQMMRF